MGWDGTRPCCLAAQLTFAPENILPFISEGDRFAAPPSLLQRQQFLCLAYAFVSP